MSGFMIVEGEKRMLQNFPESRLTLTWALSLTALFIKVADIP